MFKLTANKEDVIKFSIFSIAMFLLIAIIVNNITVFSRTGEFAGLNPFAVFLDLDTFLLTMIVTIVALLSIIFGTSSQFFEKEKGFGFGFAKKDKGGYSRWATEKEFKGELKHIYADDKVTDVAGIPLINNISQNFRIICKIQSFFRLMSQVGFNGSFNYIIQLYIFQVFHYYK